MENSDGVALCRNIREVLLTALTPVGGCYLLPKHLLAVRTALEFLRASYLWPSSQWFPSCGQDLPALPALPPVFCTALGFLDALFSSHQV